jgi:hypothetical protein
MSTKFGLIISDQARKDLIDQKNISRKGAKAQRRKKQRAMSNDSNSNFDHTDFKVWRSLYACHSEGATYRNHCSLMVEKKMFFQ